MSRDPPRNLGEGDPEHECRIVFLTASDHTLESIPACVENRSGTMYTREMCTEASEGESLMWFRRIQQVPPIQRASET